KSAEPRIDRNGGNFLNENRTRSRRGSRVHAEMWKALSRAFCAASVLVAPDGSTFRPINRKMTRATPSAGPATHHMLRMCLGVVRPRPTRLGTRIVVSDSGVILSPK